MQKTQVTARTYEDLAYVYERQGQTRLRDWFLVLAADAAHEAGDAGAAERLRGILLANNPQHLLGPFASFAEAMRSPDVRNYFQDLRRSYPPATAAQMLENHRHGEALPGTDDLSGAAMPQPEPDYFWLATNGKREDPDLFSIDDKPPDLTPTFSQETASLWNTEPDLQPPSIFPKEPEPPTSLPKEPEPEPPPVSFPKEPTRQVPPVIYNDVPRETPAPPPVPRTPPAKRPAAPSRPGRASARRPSPLVQDWKDPARPEPAPARTTGEEDEDLDDDAPLLNRWLAGFLVVVVGLAGLAAAGYVFVRPFVK